MKTIPAYLSLAAVFAIATCTPLPAREIGFVWNPQTDCDGWTLQTRADGGEWKDAPETTAPEYRGEFPDGKFEIRVRAWAKVGSDSDPEPGRIYSVPSDILAIPAQPGKPAGLKVTITVTIDIPKP